MRSKSIDLWCNNMFMSQQQELLFLGRYGDCQTSDGLSSLFIAINDEEHRGESIDHFL